MLIKVIVLEASEMYTVETDIPVEVEVSRDNLIKHKTSGVDNIPLELIQANWSKLFEEIHKILVLLGTWKNCQKNGKNPLYSIHKKGNKMKCNYHRGIPTLSTSHKMKSYPNSSQRWVGTDPI